MLNCFNCVTVLFYSVLVATWGANACNEETVKGPQNSMFTFQRNEEFCTTRFLMRTSVVLWGSAPMRDWYRRGNYFIEEPWGSVSGIPEEAVMWSVWVTENDWNRLWPSLPLIPGRYVSQCNSNCQAIHTTMADAVVLTGKVGGGTNFKFAVSKSMWWKQLE